MARPARHLVHLRLAGAYEARQDYEKALFHFEAILLVAVDNARALDGAERIRATMERLEAIKAGISTSSDSSDTAP